MYHICSHNETNNTAKKKSLTNRTTTKNKLLQVKKAKKIESLCIDNSFFFSSGSVSLVLSTLFRKQNAWFLSRISIFDDRSSEIDEKKSLKRTVSRWKKIGFQLQFLLGVSFMPFDFCLVSFRSISIDILRHLSSVSHCRSTHTSNERDKDFWKQNQRRISFLDKRLPRLCNFFSPIHDWIRGSKYLSRSPSLARSFSKWNRLEEIS